MKYLRRFNENVKLFKHEIKDFIENNYKKDYIFLESFYELTDDGIVKISISTNYTDNLGKDSVRYELTINILDESKKDLINKVVDIMIDRVEIEFPSIKFEEIAHFRNNIHLKFLEEIKEFDILREKYRKEYPEFSKMLDEIKKEFIKNKVPFEDYLIILIIRRCKLDRPIITLGWHYDSHIDKLGIFNTMTGKYEIYSNGVDDALDSYYLKGGLTLEPVRIELTT